MHKVETLKYPLTHLSISYKQGHQLSLKNYQSPNDSMIISSFNTKNAYKVKKKQTNEPRPCEQSKY